MINPLKRASSLCFVLLAMLPASQSLAAEGATLIGYGARQAEKAAIALEDGDPKAGQPKQVRCHQPDGAGPDDRDVVFSHRSGFCCGMFHRRFPFGKFMLHIYVRSTK